MVNDPGQLYDLITNKGYKIYSGSLQYAGVFIQDLEDKTDEVKKLLNFYFQNKKQIQKEEEENEKKKVPKKKRR